MQAVKCHEKYSIGQIYNYKLQIQNSILDSLPLNITSKCSIKKIIRLAANLLKINFFECALLSWLLNKTNCEETLKQLNFICEELNQKYSHENNKYTNQQSKLKGNFSNFIKIGNLQEQFDKSIFLLILLNGYNVKSFLLSSGSQIDIDPDIFTIIERYDEIYKKWKPQKSLKNISLPEINKIFQNWITTKQNKKKIDYNRIVDKILFLSKTYNVGGTNNDQGKSILKQIKSQISQVKQAINPRKKRKINQKIEKKQKNEQKNPSSRYIYEQSPMKNQNSNPVAWFEDQKVINPISQINISLRRSLRNRNRSIFEDQDDLGRNQSLFRSFNSNQSNHQNVNFFNSFQRGNNKNIGFSQLQNSLINNQNNLNFSNYGLLGGINMSESFLNDNIFNQNSLKRSYNSPTYNMSQILFNTRKPSKQNQIKKTTIKNFPVSNLKLRATDSFQQEQEQKK